MSCVAKVTALMDVIIADFRCARRRLVSEYDGG